MKSQNKQIAEHLKSGKKITALDALYQFGCFRLAARIDNLKKEGMAIKSETIAITSAGKKKHVTRYYCETAR